MRRFLRLALALPLLFAWPACSNNTPTTPSAAFDRPEHVAFFCWHDASSEVRPLEACRPVDPATLEDDIGAPPEGLTLHALVTQTTTGEVAAVRLQGVGDPGVVDTDVRVPGFTFAAVGEVPSGITVSARDPKHIFVLSRGGNSIHVIATLELLGGKGSAPEPYTMLLPTGGRPSAMRLSPDEAYLLVTLAGTGQLARIPVDGEGALGTPEYLDLATEIPTPVELTGLAADQLPPVYEYTCSVDTVIRPQVVAARTPVSDGATSEPSAMIEDPETGEILVADQALPIVHVVDPETFTETGSFTLSVPTRELAISPRVPATVGDVSPTERFLYAIDAIDHSVLVADYTDPARGSFGGVLPVSITGAADRFPLVSPARALAVLSPTYSDGIDAIPCTDADGGALAGGQSLHGVFLAIGTVDGRIRFFDVYDNDTTCRGTGTGCAVAGTSPDADDVVVAVGRHRPRIGRFTENLPLISDEPSWETDAVGALTVDSSGSPAPEIVPDLMNLDCPEPFGTVYPADATSSRICAIRDPWAATPQAFAISYEGALPSTTTTGANFQDGGATVLTHTDFCAAGVLGTDDVPTDGPLLGYPGDMVAITGDLPPSILNTTDEALRARCTALTERTTSGDITPVLIAIDRAESNLDPADSIAPGRLSLGRFIRPAAATFADVLTCYPELVQIEVRVQQAFVVRSTGAGFRHSVIEGADHGCEVDPTRMAALERGRAFFEQIFQTSEVAFMLGRPPTDLADGADRRPALSFGIPITTVPSELFIDVSAAATAADSPSLLTTLVFNEVDDRLYAVDQARAGLLRIRLTAMNVQQTFR